MDVIERLTTALNSQPSSGDRPDPEQFLNGLFSTIGIARGTAGCGAVKASGCAQPAGAEEDFQEAAPTREDLLEELRVILPAVAGMKGGVLRRIAEIVEQVDDEQAAYVWWLHAAQAGDDVAVEIVDELELDLAAERPSVLQGIQQILRLTEPA